MSVSSPLRPTIHTMHGTMPCMHARMRHLSVVNYVVYYLMNVSVLIPNYKWLCRRNVQLAPETRLDRPDRHAQAGREAGGEEGGRGARGSKCSFFLSFAHFETFLFRTALVPHPEK